MHSNSTNLTQKRVRELLNYVAETGDCTWMVRANRRLHIGDVAGYIGKGHRQIQIDGERHELHIVIWLWMTGEWPSEEIDHIDGDGLNNKWKNLRQATHSQNQWNSRKPCNNTSGFKGVIWNKQRGRWMALIKIYNKQHYLGLFDDPVAAHAAYCEAAARLHGEFARSA